MPPHRARRTPGRRSKPFAVYELLDELRERILSRYEAQILDALREERASSPPPEPSDPS